MQNRVYCVIFVTSTERNTMAHLPDDDILIREALQGNQNAYTLIVKKYESLVFTLALRLVKNSDDAHEVAQDSFLKAFRFLADFRKESKFSTWLYKITYSTGLNYLRKKRPEILSLESDETHFSLPSQDENAIGLLEKKEQRLLIESAMQQLSPDDALILTLFYLMEQHLDEICETMELTNTNAKTKLSRARQRLKAVLENV